LIIGNVTIAPYEMIFLKDHSNHC